MMLKDRARVLGGGFLSSLGLPGLGTSKPSKVTIKHEKGRKKKFIEKFEVPFNPSSLSTSSAIEWKTLSLAATTKQRSYALQFVGDSIKAATLSFDLTIDTYEGDPTAEGGWGSLISMPNPTAMHVFTPPSGVSVLPFVEKFMNLMVIAPQLHRPPLCQVWWGEILLIEGPLTNLTQDFTRFLPDGTPVRAKLGLTFTDASMGVSGETFSNDVQKTYTVRLGDTLQAIAGREYDDPSLWRTIAEANHIDDPRVLVPGTVLAIPALK
jgi:nucleoid-associated protein YgaU